MSQSQQQSQRKQQKRSIRTKQKLLDAALEAFSENGFKGTSTRDIAKRAGVHHPLITYHFSNKDRLWRSAVQHVYHDFTRALQEAQTSYADESAKTRVAAMIRIYARYAAQNPALHRIVLQESSYQSDRLEWLSDNFLRPLAETASEHIAELQKSGVTPAGDPVILYNMIRVSTGTLIALGLELKETSSIDINQEETLDKIADLIIRVFLPGDAE